LKNLASSEEITTMSDEKKKKKLSPLPFLEGFNLCFTLKEKKSALPLPYF